MFAFASNCKKVKQYLLLDYWKLQIIIYAIFTPLHPLGLPQVSECLIWHKNIISGFPSEPEEVFFKWKVHSEACRSYEQMHMSYMDFRKLSRVFFFASESKALIASRWVWFGWVWLNKGQGGHIKLNCGYAICRWSGTTCTLFMPLNKPETGEWSWCFLSYCLCLILCF